MLPRSAKSKHSDATSAKLLDKPVRQVVTGNAPAAEDWRGILLVSSRGQFTKQDRRRKWRAKTAATALYVGAQAGPNDLD